jgi:hypothetical protein
MKKILLLLIIGLLGFSQLKAQDQKEITPLIPIVKLSDNVTVKFGGFVRAEYFVDSRKHTGAVENLFGFFPENVLLDSKGNDLNAYTRGYLSSQATRFNALFSGPDVFNAKTTAFFEFDFSGGNTINVRYRHAYINLTWDKSELKIGKTWNPLGDIIFPSVIGLHTGIPFRPFGRGEQIRFTLKPSKSVSILAAAYFQSEHKSFSYITTGITPTVGSSTESALNNLTPDFHLQLRYKTGGLYAGLVSEFKTIKPITQTTGTGGTYKTNETVSSYSIGGFAEYNTGKLTVKASGLYGQNLADLFQQGGYAVNSIDSTSGARTYTPSNSITSWVNITYGKKVVVGLFGGYQKNLGFSDNILKGANNFLGRWQNIDHIYRIAPSLQYKIGRLVLAAELDYNIAGYGTVDFANKGKVKDAKDVSGARGIVAATFLF